MNVLSRMACLLVLTVLGACTSTPLSTSGEGGKVVVPTEVLGQSALPPGSTLKPEQSLILGAGDQWVGRVVADVGRDGDAAYRFFLENYPAQGWALISAVRGKTSLIVLTKQDRSATIELAEPSVLLPGTVVLTVSPRNTQTTAPRRP